MTLSVLPIQFSKITFAARPKKGAASASDAAAHAVLSEGPEADKIVKKNPAKPALTSAQLMMLNLKEMKPADFKDMDPKRLLVIFQDAGLNLKEQNNLLGVINQSILEVSGKRETAEKTKSEDAGIYRQGLTELHEEEGLAKGVHKQLSDIQRWAAKELITGLINRIGAGKGEMDIHAYATVFKIFVPFLDQINAQEFEPTVTDFTRIAKLYQSLVNTYPSLGRQVANIGEAQHFYGTETKPYDISEMNPTAVLPVLQVLATKYFVTNLAKHMEGFERLEREAQDMSGIEKTKRIKAIAELRIAFNEASRITGVPMLQLKPKA